MDSWLKKLHAFSALYNYRLVSIGNNNNTEISTYGHCKSTISYIVLLIKIMNNALF